MSSVVQFATIFGDGSSSFVLVLDALLRALSAHIHASSHAVARRSRMVGVRNVLRHLKMEGLDAVLMSALRPLTHETRVPWLGEP
ncbi:hypothetical protein OAN61_00775, partial [bacterium]|nr:hypothetical protein [bacterium]